MARSGGLMGRAAALTSTSCVLLSLSCTPPTSASSGTARAVADATDAYTVNEYPAGVGPAAGTGALPQEVALGPDDNLWFTDGRSGVFKFSPTAHEALACSSSPSAGVGCQVSASAVAPTGIVAGPDGAMYFTQSGGGGGDKSSRIGRLSTTGSYSYYPVPSPANAPAGLDAITLGPNGELWFTETLLDRIGELSTGGAVHEFQLPKGADRLATGVGSSITFADTIASGDGDIWFTEQGSGAIRVMSTGGKPLQKYTLPNANLSPDPLGITEGPGTTMWFTEFGANEVGSINWASGKVSAFALPAGVSGPGSIIYGPDGNLWFTYEAGVATINPSTDKFSLYRAHAANPGPVGITVGPGCTSVWFTESTADLLGRVAPVPDKVECKAIGEVPHGTPPTTVPGTATATVLAGVRVRSSGAVVNWFNDFGGAPKVAHTAGSGVYDIAFPGASFQDGNTVLEATPDTPSGDCTAINADYAISGGTTVIVVETKDCTNAFSDRGFHLVVFGSGVPTSSNTGTVLAGASISSTGGVGLGEWNDFGGQPQLTHTAGSGVYYIAFPGAPLQDGNTVVEVTPYPGCTAVNADFAISGGTTLIAVETKDCANAFADTGFDMVVFGTAAPTISNSIAALAGARVQASGAVSNWFSTIGGEPQVTHSAGSGSYAVTFPGVSSLKEITMMLATPDTPSADCTTVGAAYLTASSLLSGDVQVRTDNCTTGIFSDRGFHLVLFGTPPS